MPDKNNNHRSDVGYTIPAFAERFGLSESRVRRAVKRKEIVTETFAGRERITPAEAKRVAELFGLKVHDNEKKTGKDRHGQAR
jgi:hypothetical protein